VRNLGRPEASLIGVQYVANNYGIHQGAYSRTRRRPLGLCRHGSRQRTEFGHYGYEIDIRSPATPPGTILLASIPDLMGPGRTAEMTYYETAAGAKVFAAGRAHFGASVGDPVVARILDNLWRD